MKYVIETESLCKRHGSTYRVRNICLQVPEGSVYGFLGPNGAGKTTTLKLLLGLIHPDSGRISILGKDMNQKNHLPLLRKTGSLIENPSGYGHLTGLENMQIIAKLKGVPSEDIFPVLHTVHLYEQRDKKLKNYSLGMKQRLGLAMALLGRPQILILDEPTNGLDPAGIQEMRNLIRSLPETFGMTVLLSSHLLNEVELMADHAGVIHHGELLYQGSLRDLEGNSKNLEEVFLEMTGGEGGL